MTGMTSLVTDTTNTTDMERDDEQTTDSDTHVRQRDDEQTTDSDTYVRQRPAAQTRPLTEIQTAHLPRTAFGVIAVNWK